MNVIKDVNKVKRIIDSSISKNKYETALIAIKMLANLYYEYNQIYTDIELENKILEINSKLLKKEDYDVDKNCVFFYDGFGLDLRGWAASYIRTLISLEYYVIYACPNSSKGKIPHIVSELNKESSEIIYVDSSFSMTDKAKKIDSIFKEYKPTAAFFYTNPFDVSAAIAFSNNTSSTRFQIDLTDHAYWIGVNSIDYSIDGREMGASIAHYERGIPKEKILKLDCVPYINRNSCNVELPFDIRREKYIFTGGALYKTLGDEDLLYYKAITYILDIFHDIKFLYAGSGDDSEIQKLISKYKGRVFLINERPDFFEIIKHCTLYINSYPMFGGLMMRYAALARKVPITLRHGNDADGILINQSELGIEFDYYQDYILEIYRLLSNDDYRKSKENLVENSVLTESRFASNLKLLIDEHKTELQFDKIQRFDTTEFRLEYKRRFTKEILYKLIGQKSNLKMLRYFPVEFALGIIIRIKEKLKK